MLTRALPVVAAASVILAGWVLWRTCKTRRDLRHARWVIAACSAYGAATFVYAAAAGITIRQTPSSVPRLVVYGALIGAFVVVPLGWVLSVLRTGFPRLRTGSVGPAAFQAIALTICMALLFTSLPQKQGSSASGATMSKEERMQSLERSLRAVEEGERNLPRDRWDPDYILTMVGRDPQKLFSWVSDNTFWIPYHGVLRGPVGVLMDRQGNSLDRGLLLATLLQRAGYAVRVVHGQLTVDNVRELLPGLVARRRVYAGESPISTPEPAQVQTTAQTAPRQKDVDFDHESAESVPAHYEPVADAVGRRFTLGQDAADSRDLLSRVAAETAGLLAGLGRPDPTKDWNSRAVQAAKALADHWWVQLQDQQNWTDFDLLSSAPNHGPLVPPADTVAVNNLAAELYHQITIRVLAEQWSGRSVNVHKALEYTLRPAELIGQPVVLQFWPTAWLGDLSDAAARHTLGEAASQDQWAAALSVGKQSVAQTFLIESGAGADEQPKGGELGALGSAIAGALSRTAKPDGELSAVWIEYEIRPPGGQLRTVRRTVFDLLGPQARSAGIGLSVPLDPKKKLSRALALMMRTEIEPMTCAVAPEFVQHLVAQNLLQNRALLSAIARREIAIPTASAAQTPSDAIRRAENTPEELMAQASPPISPLLALAAARLRPGYSANPAFVDRPNILTRHRFFVPVADQIAAMDAIDIVANEVGVDLATPEAFPIRLWQGVLDTNLEAHVGFASATGNVGQAFATTKGWLMIAPSQRSELAKRFTSLPADARQQLFQDLSGGNVVVSPEAPVHEAGGPFIGWWRINQTTGDTLGVADNGWGQSMSETATLTEYANTAARAFNFEFAMCQFGAQVMNVAWRLNERVFGGWHPSWTGHSPSSKLPSEVVKENVGGCLIQAMVQGALATLPLLLITLRLRGTRLAAEEMEAAAERAAARAEGRGPCIARLQDRSIDILPAFAMPLLRGTPMRLNLSVRSNRGFVTTFLAAIFWQNKGGSGGSQSGITPGPVSPLANTLRPVSPLANSQLGQTQPGFGNTIPLHPEEPPLTQPAPGTHFEAAAMIKAAKEAAEKANVEHSEAVGAWIRYNLNDPAIFQNWLEDEAELQRMGLPPGRFKPPLPSYDPTKWNCRAAADLEALMEVKEGAYWAAMERWKQIHLQLTGKLPYLGPTMEWATR